MDSWIWLILGVITLFVAAAAILKYISIKKYKRHIKFLKSEMKSGREELEKIAGEKNHVEKEMAVIKNIYRNKLVHIHESEKNNGKRN
jgi:hypothetical protein